MIRPLIVGVSTDPPPGYGPPMETRPPQCHHRTNHVPDYDSGITTDSHDHTTSTNSAMSAHSSQDITIPNYTAAKRSPEIGSDAWDDVYHRGLEGNKDISISKESPRQEVASQVHSATTRTGARSPRHGRRKGTDYLLEYNEYPVEDNDGTGTYVNGNGNSQKAPQKESKSARHVAKEDRDDETEDDEVSYQEAKDNDTSEEEEETDGRFSTSSASDIIKARQSRVAVRRRSESESPYEDHSIYKHRSRKSSKKSKRSKQRSETTKAKSKSKKSQRRKQPSPTHRNVSTISSDSIRSITPPRNTITTKLCHPIAFNYPNAITPCSLCDVKFALLGHGLRTVIVHDQGHDADAEEVTPSGSPTIKVCVPCTTSRMRILICRKHILQAIDDVSITSTQFGDAFKRVLDKQPLHTDVWCSVCPAPALYKCVGSEIMRGDAGCGLRLCELCAVGLHEGAKGVLDGFLKGVGEGGEERPLGVRADAELLRMNGSLAGFMIRMAGEDWDE